MLKPDPSPLPCPLSSLFPVSFPSPPVLSPPLPLPFPHLSRLDASGTAASSARSSSTAAAATLLPVFFFFFQPACETRPAISRRVFALLPPGYASSLLVYFSPLRILKGLAIGVASFPRQRNDTFVLHLSFSSSFSLAFSLFDSFPLALVLCMESWTAAGALWKKRFFFVFAPVFALSRVAVESFFCPFSLSLSLFPQALSLQLTRFAVMAVTSGVSSQGISFSRSSQRFSLRAPVSCALDRL